MSKDSKQNQCQQRGTDDLQPSGSTDSQPVVPAKPKRIQVTTTLDPEIFERVKQQPEPLSKFLDRAITNELSRSTHATARLAEAFQPVRPAANACFRTSFERCRVADTNQAKG